jgi:hypothetical protein
MASVSTLSEFPRQYRGCIQLLQDLFLEVNFLEMAL